MKHACVKLSCSKQCKTEIILSFVFLYITFRRIDFVNVVVVLKFVTLIMTLLFALEFFFSRAIVSYQTVTDKVIVSYNPIEKSTQ